MSAKCIVHIPAKYSTTLDNLLEKYSVLVTNTSTTQAGMYKVTFEYTKSEDVVEIQAGIQKILAGE